MNHRINQALAVFLLSAILGIVVNAVSGNGIPIIGNWPSLSGSGEVVKPPSADEGDPPFISLDEAAALYQSSGVVFIDARDPEDYEYGHIKGAVSIPYDYLPDDNLDEYWKNKIREIPFNKKIVIYCSGTECESSLYLGRDMVHYGYKKVNLFYGGWREWEKAGLPVVSKQI